MVLDCIDSRSLPSFILYSYMNAINIRISRASHRLMYTCTVVDLFEASPCADPESFVRGGPNSITLFLVDEEIGDPNVTMKWAIIGPTAKRHLNGISLAGQ